MNINENDKHLLLCYRYSTVTSHVTCRSARSVLYNKFQKWKLAIIHVSNNNLPFLQRVSIGCYAERCTSHTKSVRLSDRPSAVWPFVCYTLVSCQSHTSYDHADFSGDSPRTLVSWR